MKNKNLRGKRVWLSSGIPKRHRKGLEKIIKKRGGIVVKGTKNKPTVFVYYRYHYAGLLSTAGAAVGAPGAIPGAIIGSTVGHLVGTGIENVRLPRKVKLELRLAKKMGIKRQHMTSFLGSIAAKGAEKWIDKKLGRKDPYADIYESGE